MSPKQHSYLVALCAILFVASLFWFNGTQESAKSTEHEALRTKPISTTPSTKYQVYNIETPASLESVSKKNRDTLSRAPRWMDSDEVYNGAYFKYGLPEFARPWINLDVGESFTIPDVLGYLLTSIRREPESVAASGVKYLEIGVSVGKCLFQMLELEGSKSTVTALDIENINPAFADTLTGKKRIDSWDAEPATLLRNDGSYHTFKASSGATLNYFATDEFSSKGWEKIVEHKAGPFHVIYSDAMHSPGALEYEWEKLISLNLIDFSDYWAVTWDDLGDGGMRSAVQKIMDSTINIHPDSKGRFYYVNGWLGKNEHTHVMGVLTNVDLDELDLKIPTQ